MSQISQEHEGRRECGRASSERGRRSGDGGACVGPNTMGPRCGAARASGPTPWGPAAVAGKLVAFAHAYERWRFSARTRARTEVTARVSGPTPWGPAAVAGKLVAFAHAFKRGRISAHTLYPFQNLNTPYPP